jgi:predicted acyl esterase
MSTTATSLTPSPSATTIRTTHRSDERKDNLMKHSALDQPWHRRGAIAYARTRRRAALHPPVTVYPMPADITKDEDVAVPMRDGVTLRLNLFRPAGPGPFPVILSAHPYGKDSVPTKKRGGWKLNKQFRIMNQPERLTISDQTSWEAPDPVWWAQQGYAVINLDTRGGGHSDGRGDLLSDQEADDIAQAIAWAAGQPWSNGRIGMLGVSYLALSQYKVAGLNPPALRAICPWEGFTDAYRDFFTPGGIVESGFARIWLFLTNRLARLNTDLAAERRKHPLWDEWWEALTPDLSTITVPMLVCTSFSDANLHSVGSMRAFQQAGSTERHAYAHRGPKWATFYGDEARQTQLAFFDRHLRERDVPTLPPMRLEIRDRADHVVEVRDEQEWPLARTDWLQLYLGADGTLNEHPDGDGRVTFDLRRNAAAFNYRFEQDTELSGPMTLRLQVATSGTDDPRLFVGVEKWSHGKPVGFNGSYGYGRDRIAQGRLRLALRELDPQRSTPHQPEHSFRTLQPIQANEQLEVLIPLSSSATLFRAGDSLRLMVAGRYLQPRNPLFGHFPTHYEPSSRGKATILWTPDRPSTLEIPVIP